MRLAILLCFMAFAFSGCALFTATVTFPDGTNLKCPRSALVKQASTDGSTYEYDGRGRPGVLESAVGYMLANPPQVQVGD